MAAVNMKTGLKMVGDRASGVSGAAAAIAGMSFDDNTHTFLNTDTALNTQGASPSTPAGIALDSTPTGGAAATPYVVTHIGTLNTAAGFDTKTVKRIAIHNSNAPTDSSATLMFGVDGFSIVKAASFTMPTTFKLSYT